MGHTYQLTLGKYFTRVKGLLYTHLRPILAVQQINTIERTDTEKTLELTIAFRDRSKLSGIETLTEEGDSVRVLRYGYEYERCSGFFFFYEMERVAEPSNETKCRIEAIAAQVKKPYHHMHVGAKKETTDRWQDFPPELREHGGPHYGTYPVSLEYVLAVIITNYFPEQRAILRTLDVERFLS